MVMTDLWSTAVGLSVLPLRRPSGWRYAIPGPLFGFLLVLVWPRDLWWVYILTLVLTAPVLGAALRLITTDRRQTVQRALLIMALAIGPYFITPRIPEPYQWFFMPLVVFIMFGIPVGIMLLIEETASRHKWVAPTIAGFCFAGAWGVWMARDYFYRLKL